MVKIFVLGHYDEYEYECQRRFGDIVKACMPSTCDVKPYDFTALSNGLAKQDFNVCMYTATRVQYSLEPLLVQNANSSFQPKPHKIFNDIKWQNLVLPLIKFENFQKLEYSKFVSYDL